MKFKEASDFGQLKESDIKQREIPNHKFIQLVWSVILTTLS